MKNYQLEQLKHTLKKEQKKGTFEIPLNRLVNSIIIYYYYLTMMDIYY